MITSNNQTHFATKLCGVYILSSIRISYKDIFGIKQSTNLRGSSYTHESFLKPVKTKMYQGQEIVNENQSNRILRVTTRGCFSNIMSKQKKECNNFRIKKQRGILVNLISVMESVVHSHLINACAIKIYYNISRSDLHMLIFKLTFLKPYQLRWKIP